MKLVKLVCMLLLSLASCIAPVGVGSLAIPADAATNCASNCAAVDMKLAAVVTMASNVGCVCQPAKTAESSEGAVADAEPSVALSSGSATAAGMVTIMLAQQAQQQQEEQQRQQQMRQRAGR